MFDFNTDLKVLVNVPDGSGLFYNIGNWDQQNWGGSGGYEFVDFAHRCSEIQTSNGVSAIGTTIDLGSKQATIVLTAQDDDPLDSKTVVIGADVKLQVTVPGFTDLNWFVAKVTGIQRDVDSSGLNRVVITLGDQIEQLTSTEVTISEIADQTFYERWVDIQNAVLGDIPIVLSYAAPTKAQFTFPGIDIFETALLDTVNETMAGELGWLFTDNLGTVYPYAHGALLEELGTPQWLINQDGSGAGIPPTYINQGSDTQSIVNTINASLTWDPGTIISKVDTDSVDLVGPKTADIEVNLADETQLNGWAYYALTLSDQQNIRSMSFDAIDHSNGELYELFLFNPGTCVQLDVRTGQLHVDENYLVSKVMHIITPDTWQTELELWRN